MVQEATCRGPTRRWRGRPGRQAQRAGPTSEERTRRSSARTERRGAPLVGDATYPRPPGRTGARWRGKLWGEPAARGRWADVGPSEGGPERPARAPVGRRRGLTGAHRGRGPWRRSAAPGEGAGAHEERSAAAAERWAGRPRTVRQPDAEAPTSRARAEARHRRETRARRRPRRRPHAPPQEPAETPTTPERAQGDKGGPRGNRRRTGRPGRAGAADEGSQRTSADEANGARGVTEQRRGGRDGEREGEGPA